MPRSFRVAKTRAMRLRLAFAVLICVTAADAAAQNVQRKGYVMTEAMHHEIDNRQFDSNRVEKIVAGISDALIAQDMGPILDAASDEIRVTDKGSNKVMRKQDLLALKSRLFNDPEMMKAVSDESRFILRSESIGINGGEFWISEDCLDTKCDQKKNSYRHDQLALNGAFAADASGDRDFELKDRLKNLLAFEEGRIVLPNGLHVAYKDSKGILTIGYGFNLEDGSAPQVLRQVTSKTTTVLMAKTDFLTEEEAQALLFISEEVAMKGVRSFFPTFDSIGLPRRIVLAAMVYQMGEGRFGKFRRLIPAVQRQDWDSAVESMQQSQWYRGDSPKRAKRMAEAMRTDTFPPAADLSGKPGSIPGRAPVIPSRIPVRAPEPFRPPEPQESPSTTQSRRSSWPFDN